jgi:hypothetical protein
VVDTSYAAPEIVAHTIERAFNAKRAGQPTAQCWMSPKRLLDAPITDEAPEASSDSAVTIRATDGMFVIASGRAHVEAALRDGVPLIAAELAASPG